MLKIPTYIWVVKLGFWFLLTSFFTYFKFTDYEFKKSLTFYFSSVKIFFIIVDLQCSANFCCNDLTIHIYTFFFKNIPFRPCAIQ